MPIPPQFLAAQKGKKKGFAGKGDDDSKGPDALDIAQAAKARLAGKPAMGGKKKGSMPPWLMKGK